MRIAINVTDWRLIKALDTWPGRNPTVRSMKARTTPRERRSLEDGLVGPLMAA
jgi:hypothetical protein